MPKNSRARIVERRYEECSGQSHKDIWNLFMTHLLYLLPYSGLLNPPGSHLPIQRLFHEMVVLQEYYVDVLWRVSPVRMIGAADGRLL